MDLSEYRKKAEIVFERNYMKQLLDNFDTKEITNGIDKYIIKMGLSDLSFDQAKSILLSHNVAIDVMMPKNDQVYLYNLLKDYVKNFILLNKR